MSSGGISSRLSGSVRSGSDDGSKIRCEFHGEANSPLVHGMACAFADDPRPSRIAAAGTGKRLKRHRPGTRMERNRSPLSPDAFRHASANSDPITHPLRVREGGEHLLGGAHRSENDRRLRIRRQASYSIRGRKVLSCEIEVMRSLATRLAGKSFPRGAKYFALQNADCDDSATNAVRSRAACTSSAVPRR